MTRSDKQSLIRKAANYNSDKRAAASCNSLYMGSMATSMLFGALGARYGTDGLEDALVRASDLQLDAGLAQCQNIIKYGKITV